MSDGQRREFRSVRAFINGGTLPRQCAYAQNSASPNVRRRDNSESPGKQHCAMALVFCDRSRMFADRDRLPIARMSPSPQSPRSPSPPFRYFAVPHDSGPRSGQVLSNLRSLTDVGSRGRLPLRLRMQELRLIRPARLFVPYRGLAAVLLLLVFADVSLAGTCCGECNDAPGGYELTASRTGPADGSDSVAREDGQHEHPMAGCEDCFCCSLKPLPESGFMAVERRAESSAGAPSEVSFPSSPPRIPFHPPRRA